ncbi:hypothetical protein ACAG24_005190 [Mycobacterium sp. pW049]|uniref:hypothetical protein n=1 Tax=[Mycobacterium] bulgaricum TaxID=3238985 RepID=UPI00351BA6F0
MPAILHDEPAPLWEAVPADSGAVIDLSTDSTVTVCRGMVVLPSFRSVADLEPAHPRVVGKARSGCQQRVYRHTRDPRLLASGGWNRA